jgi:adenylyltransferase/sulfurtransferase
MAGRLLIFDALELSFREVRLRSNPHCPVCGEEPTLKELVDYDLFCGVGPVGFPPSRTPIPQITSLELNARLEDTPGPFLLDVRERYEWEIGNLAGLGAHLIPFGEIQGRLGELPREGPLVVYCHVGVRSVLVVETLLAQGFQEVFNLKGGYLAWVNDVNPDLPRY